MEGRLICQACGAAYSLDASIWQCECQGLLDIEFESMFNPERIGARPRTIGMRQMTRALAIEWAADNIQVNAIAPGRFWTAMTDAVFSDEALYDSAVSVIPQGRPGIPADLAGATVLLASDASNYMTGETIVVDGGWLVNGGVKG